MYYGHNASSLPAVLLAIERFPSPTHGRLFRAGDRRDEDIVRQGEILADAFDPVILYEDQYRRGRTPGEITDLFRQGMSAGKRVMEIKTVEGWAKAVDLALQQAQPLELVLVQADVVDKATSYVEEVLAMRGPCDDRRDPARSLCSPFAGSSTNSLRIDRPCVKSPGKIRRAGSHGGQPHRLMIQNRSAVRRR